MGLLVIVSSLVMYEALLKQKSLSNQEFLFLFNAVIKL